MSRQWPKDTIWLGGRWTSLSRWEWDDGTPAHELSWAPGQPSGQGSQEREPWLCMLANGKVHDSDAGTPPYSFGVMCENKQTTEQTSQSAVSNRISFCCADANDPADVCGTCTSSSSGPCGNSRLACEACPGSLEWCFVGGVVADSPVVDAGLVISRSDSDGSTAGGSSRQMPFLRRVVVNRYQVAALALAAFITLSAFRCLWKRKRTRQRRSDYGLMTLERGGEGHWSFHTGRCSWPWVGARPLHSQPVE